MALIGQLFGGAAEEAFNVLSTYCKEQVQIARGQQEASVQDKRYAQAGITITVAISMTAAAMGLTYGWSRWATKPATTQDQLIADQIVAGRIDVACGPGLGLAEKRMFARGSLSNQADAASWVVVQTARRQAGYCIQVGP